MYQGWTAAKFREKIFSIIEATKRNLKPKDSPGENLHVVVFIDELNTASNVLGLLKEIFVDHRIDGDKIPSNIFFVGAINPSDSKRKDSEYQEYVVHKLPSSMDQLILDFDELSPEQAEEFIQLKLDSMDTEYKDQLVRLILWSQKFVSDQKLDRVRTSIRDMVRVITFYNFFKQNWILNEHDSILKLQEPGKQKGGLQLQQHFIIMFMSIALSYYFRLPSSLKRGEREVNLREEFAKEISKVIKSDPKFFGCQLEFKEVVDSQLEAFYSRIESGGGIPRGIAKTTAFMENLFCNIVCIQSKVPLIIVS